MKNKFLLLGATALLSTTALMANAEFQRPELKIKAEAEFATGIEINYGQNMRFGVVDPRAGGNVVIDNETGHLSGTAMQIHGELAGDDNRGRIDLTGVKGFYDSWGAASEFIQITFDEDTIDLYEDEETKAKKCATIGSLNYKVGDYNSAGTGALTVYTSGTLNVDSTYPPTGGYAKCTGSVTATYVLSDDD